jgi:branched-chain amino acid transport system substrate-binding protein
MKKKMIWVFVAMIVVVAAYIFTVNNKDVSTENGTVKIGIIAPLTGPLAEYGEAFKNGITLAQDKNKKSKIVFIFEDSSEDPKKAISAFYKLRDQDNVNLIFNWGAASSQAIAPLVNDSDIVFLSNSSEPEVTKPSKYIVRTAYRAEDYASTMWNYFRTQGYKNIGIIKLDIVFFNELLQNLEKQAKPDEKVVVVDNYLSFGDRDFKTSILKIKNSNIKVDTLGIFLVQGQVSQFYNQANVYGFSIPTFGTDVFESQSELTNAGQFMSGATYALNDFSTEFKNDYKKSFGNIGQISYAANSYDIASFLMSKADFKNKDTIIDSLKTNNYQGVAGIYEYKNPADDRSFSAPVVLKTITNGDLNSDH